ncbi:MAG: tetratricopeptide repeat protein, partial [Burkholderiales bacterium]
CFVPLEKRRAEKPPDDCARCHLPKRDVGRISHSALTNHRIIRWPGAPLPESAFQRTGSGLQDLVHVSAVPGRSAEATPRLTLLQAYGELSDSHPEYRPRYLELLDQVAAAFPTDMFVFSALARRASLKGTAEARAEAMRFLSRAIEAGSTSPGDYKDYADLLAQEGRLPEAIEVLQRGVALAPFTSILYKALALHYIKASRHPEALETMKQVLALFPEDSLMRRLVQQAEAARPVR